MKTSLKIIYKNYDPQISTCHKVLLIMIVTTRNMNGKKHPYLQKTIEN